MQTKIKYNINWYKPEEETTRNKFGGPRDRTQALTKGWDFLERGMIIGANAQVVFKCIFEIIYIVFNKFGWNISIYIWIN